MIMTGVVEEPIGTIVLRDHDGLLRSVARPPAVGDQGRAAARLARDFELHLCTADDEESAAELQSLLGAWSALGHPADLWWEIEGVVIVHVERFEARMAAGVSRRSPTSR